MNAEVFDSTRCSLGEGPLWHPIRKQLFWFDILQKRMLARRGDDLQIWFFSEMVSAAGWVDLEHLLIASETQLFVFNVEDGAKEHLVMLERENTVTRSNDGRADPWGGFWISTMGHQAEAGAGSIYRYYRGQMKKLFGELTIPNAISFSPDRKSACYTDTATGKVMRQPLDVLNGWPEGEAQVMVDLEGQTGGPDGAVFDARGNLWIAEWGAGRVGVYAPDGQFLGAHEQPAKQCSCPAFIGPELTDLVVTTATQGMSAEDIRQEPQAGHTFVHRGVGAGQKEHQVIL